MAEKEIVLINGALGRMTLNFQGAFPNNKSAKKGGKFYLSEKEFEYVKANYSHLLEGETQRLFREGEEKIPGQGAAGQDEMKAFFAQSANKVKAAFEEMSEEQLEHAYKYAQLHEDELTEATYKKLENRILELDKQKQEGK